MKPKALAVLFCLLPGPLLGHYVPIAEKNPLAGDAMAAQEGKKLYADLCQVCHGGDGRGGRGPDLASGNFQHGGEDWQLFQIIRQGIPGTQMPAFGKKDEEIWQLVTYLRTLSAPLSEEPVPGNADLGREVFVQKGGCLACHQINGRGGRVGPDLSTVGRWSPKALREVILNPNPREARQGNVVVVKTRDGRRIRGLRKNEDTFSLQLMDAREQLHLLQKKDFV